MSSGEASPAGQRAKGRRSSLGMALGPQNTTAIQMLQARLTTDDEAVECEDTMETGHLDLLCMSPDERETSHIDGITQLLTASAPEFCSALNEDQLTEVGRSALYHYFSNGEMVCDTDEETSFYFVLLRGSVVIEERQVHHQEGSSGSESQTRQKVIEAGKGFHHFPLVMQYRFYGYSARVTGNAGASILLISKVDYIHILRRSVEKEMNDTVRAPASCSECFPG